MELLTTMIAYFMVELNTILRYKVLTFSSETFSQLQVIIPSCQQQTNGVDCWIYVVANAFKISSGIGASDIKIDKNRLEYTFFSIYSRMVLKRFPKKQRNTVSLFSPEKISTVDIFCICKM